MLLRILSVLTLTCLASINLMAADSPFLGKWKANLGKSQVTGTSSKIEDLGNGSYKLIFGDDVDTFIIDGQEHPTAYGSMRTATAEGANKWKTVSKRDGKLASTGSFTLSEDGQTLTRSFEINRPDGTVDKQTFKDKRTGGTTGMAGTWENMDFNVGDDVRLEIRPFEGDGLSFVNVAYQEQDDFKFDGKDYPNTGPRITPGATTSGKRLAERTIELTDKVKGKLVDTQRIELSANGKTLTTVYTSAGVEKTQTVIFERE